MNKILEPGEHDPTVPEAAVASLYKQYSNNVFRYARMVLGNTSEAHDVVQDVFIRALRSWPTYRGESDPSSWIMTIARNQVYDVLRKRRTWRKHIASTEQQDRELRGMTDGAVSLDLVLEVNEALSQLKPSYRQVVVLRYMENFSVSEIANILGWSESKVRTTCHRAVTKLQGIMTAQEEGDR